MSHAAQIAAKWPPRLAAVTLVVSGLVVVGWFVDMPWLTGAGVTFTTTKLPIAFGFASAAIGILIRARLATTPREHVSRGVVAFGSVTVLLALATLTALLAPDTALGEAARRVITLAPGGRVAPLPTPLSGFALLVIGAALIADSRARGAHFVSVAGLMLCLAWMLTILTVAFAIAGSRPGFLGPSAVPALLCTILLSVSLLLLHPGFGLVGRLLDAGLVGETFRWLFIAGVVAPIMFGFLPLAVERLGLFSAQSGQAAFALTITLLFGVVAWTVSGQIAKADATRARAVAALAESELRFHNAFQHAGIGMAIVGLDGRWLEVNDALCNIVAYPREELARLTFQDITHPEDLASDLALMQEMVDGKRNSYEMQKRYIRKDGGVAYVVLNGSVTRDEDGRPVQYLAAVEDITTRVETERALRESYELQRAITDGADLSIIAGDLDGTITLFNPGAERMLGYRAEEVVGRVTPAILHDPDEVVARASELTAQLGVRIEPGFEAFVAIARRGGADQREWTYIRKDGSRLRVLLSVTALRDAEGKIFQFLGIASDVTAIRVAAEALEESNREKEVLLREVHHRVKNNLQVVSSVLNMQARYSDDPVVTQMFAESRERVRAMALIHERLQGASGFGEVDFTAYSRDLISLLRLASADDRADVVLGVEGDSVHVSLDMATPLGLVLNELVSNALKHAFGPGESGRVVVRVSGPAEGFRMEVTNGGRPIPASFDLANASSLGLRLVRALAVQVDGQVSVQQQPEPAIVITAPWPKAVEEIA